VLDRCFHEATILQASVSEVLFGEGNGRAERLDPDDAPEAAGQRNGEQADAAVEIEGDTVVGGRFFGDAQHFGEQVVGDPDIGLEETLARVAVQLAAHFAHYLA
jgi:hypothetical protein